MPDPYPKLILYGVITGRVGFVLSGITLMIAIIRYPFYEIKKKIQDNPHL